MCEKQTAISMPQAVTSDVAEAVLIFKFCKKMSDAVRVDRLAVDIDGKVILIKMLVKISGRQAETNTYKVSGRQ